MEPKFNVWVEHEGVVVLSAWRVKLLLTIEATGSITAAAAQLEVPYRRAWEKVQEIELGLGFKVIETAVGGTGGGGAHLTPAGQRVIQQFQKLTEGLEGEIDKRYRKSFRDGA